MDSERVLSSVLAEAREDSRAQNSASSAQKSGATAARVDPNQSNANASGVAAVATGMSLFYAFDKTVAAETGGAPTEGLAPAQQTAAPAADAAAPAFAGGSDAELSPVPAAALQPADAVVSALPVDAAEAGVDREVSRSGGFVASSETTDAGRPSGPAREAVVQSAQAEGEAPATEEEPADIAPETAAGPAPNLYSISALSDADTSGNAVDENAAVGSRVGITALASDADAADRVTYSLSDDAGGLFAIDAVTGEVTVAGALDFESVDHYAIEVTATSSDGSVATMTYTIAINDVNEVVVSAVSDTDAAANMVNENAAVGTSVGITAFASDADGTASVSYSLSNDAGGRFAIDPTTGEVTVAGSLDREAAASYQIEVTATSSDGSTSTQTYTIGLNDQDEFNVSPVTDTNAAANGLAENAAAGTAVGVVASASDADATNNAVTYSVDDARFTVDADGTVRVAAGASFDYETESSIGITVTATSADGSTSSQAFTLAVSDVNEAAVSAISDTNAAGNNVNENAAVGTSVGITAFATDSDGTSTVSYSLSNDAGGRFAIDPTTGEVTVAGSLDRETAASYQIEVTATSSDGSTSTQTYTIGLNDQDEFNVSPVTDTNAAANGLAENAAAGTAVGVVASASDADATTNAVTYSVDDARFTVDADGTVRVAAGASFDYETEASVGITVTATSADGSTSSQAFTLAVSDVNEAAVSAISDTNAAGNTVNENAAVGTSVGITAFASDADGTSSVSYSLSNDAGGRFAIDPTTGEVTVAGSLDRETAASYQIEVTATSSDGSTSTQTYTIGLNDQDEFNVSPVTDTNAAANGLAENAAAGSAVGVVASASDADATTNAISYSVDDARFTVDADGTVRVAAGASFDYETEATIGITVTATSADGSTSSQAFTLAVSDVNEAAVSAISDTNAAGNTVNENAAVGTSVGITAFASDADGTSSVSYSLSNDAGGKFAIDATTGEVTVAGSLDRETAASYQIEVTATSSDGSTSTQTYTIGLNDQDEFNVSPVTDTNAAANGLAENAAAGTAVGVVASASDADATTNAVTYSVDDARFTVDADGTVRVAAGASFDYETESSIGITVTATSADGSSSSQAFTLAVSDVNEAAVSAISDTNAAGNAVNENAAVGTSVGITAFATDSDGTSTVSYSLSNDAGGRFAIDPTTGEVTVAGSLDRETAASYQVEVTATSSDGSTSTQTYTIGLNDQDEFNVSPVTDTNAAANGLAENAAAGTAVGVVASASDADATTNAVTYSVDDARFTVDADGTVRVAAGASFDYETESSIGITVTATSADGSTSSQAFTLAVSDVNEAAVSAISDTNAAGNNVNENAAVGTSVGITAFASDADGTSSVSYSLSNDAGGRFAIDPTTGEVTVAGSLDRETAASYQIEVTATSSDGSTSTQTYTIGLNDQDEFNVSPVTDTNAAANGVAENAAAGTAVGVVASASDADATTNAVTYSVDDARFTVDADGTVRVAAGANFDYETESSIGITVTATSADGSTSSQAFTLAVSDVNEAAVSAISDTNAAGNTVNENAAVGTSVGITAFATDSDGTSTVSYSLSNDAGGRFAIDPTTGEVTVAGSLDREVAASYQIEVTATSSDGSTSTQTYTIGLNDQDEFNVSPVTDTNAVANGLAENAAAGTAVGVVASASDADATTNAVSYSVDDARFTVDADGTVRVAAGASFDYETEASIGITVTATSADGSTSSQAFTLAVSDVNEAAVSAISDTNAAGNNVNENAAVGTSVGITAFASDADGTSSVSYSLSNDAGGKFVIDPTTGEVTVAGTLDRETAASYQIEVTATSSDGSTSTQTYTIGLNDQDEFNVSPVTDTNAVANGLAENAAAGTAVGVVASASDADATTNAVIYSVDDARFTVDADGTVRVATGASFDYETESSIGITVTATSADGSTSNQAFTLAVSDVNEAAVSAISDTNAAGNNVNENAAVGTSVGITAFASDADGTSSVSYSLSNDAGGRFAIDPTTGEVTVAGSLDRETAASYQIEVTATSSDGSTSTQTYTIGLNDQDEFNVSPVTDTNAAANGLAENAAAGTAVGVVASASDADATTNAVTYSVDDARFTVDADGTVRVAAGASFDYETESSIGITVTATSADGSTSSQAFTLAVSDVNEAAVSAISDTNAAGNSVNENAAVGTSVGITAFASDADGSSSVSYSLSNDAGGRFAIDPTTGEVTVAGSLDREAAASYQIEVTATSTDGSTSTQTYTIGLNDQDEFNVSPVTDTNAAANGLAENAAAGTAVGVVASASDADATTNAVSYSVDDARFTVDADGTVRVAAGASFDYETESSIGITVTATSADGSTSSQAFTLAVSDVNEAAVSAISDTNAAGNTVNENAVVGTSVGITAFASDADGTSSVSYSLSNDAGGKFAIDATTGEVTVAGSLDRETAASYQIEVTATSSDGSTSTQTYTIGLNDQDEFNVSPVTDTNAAADAVTENAAVGTTVGIAAFASDGDATTNGVTYTLTDNAGGKFAINATTGVVTVAGAIDREAGATQSITVQATSADGSTSTQTYTIAVNDANEFAVSAVSDTNAAANAVTENAAIGTTVGVTAFASDADATGNGVTYSLSDSAGGKFAIDATTGVVTVAGAIDRESGATQSITVVATSADGSTSSQAYSIAVNDVNEFAVSAVSDSNAAANAVTENAAIGTTVGVTAFASDADATGNGVTYSLTDSAGGKFAINAITGVVTVAGAIDREAGATQSITVQATSADGSTSTQTYAITINDVDEFDVTAISDTNASANAVSENAAIGTTVGVTAFASDADATGNGVTYSLTDSAGGKFAINATTGVVTVAGAIDREAGATQTITVQATSADGSTSTQTYAITINDVDEFDVTAISDSNATANAVTENAAVGTMVGITAAASDADATNSGITYSLSDSAGGKFAINATTGVVTVAGAIDRESGATQSITVVATSADGSSSSQIYSITVNDANEFAVSAVSDTNAAANAVTENAAVGTTVGVTAFASDGDATNSGVTYSLSDSAGGKFAINSTTGVVTVAGAIDREAGSTQSITVVATSADGSTSTQTYAITINDVDEFDVTAISDSNATANAVTENAAVGTTVGITAAASDADATNSGITYSLSDSAGGKFAINSSTGVVTVAGAIDRESGATQSITVVATSADGSSSSQTYSIAVADVDEFDVTAISDSNAVANAVNENATVGTTVGITAFASDGDATNSGVTYSLTNSAGGKFAINSTTGVVTVAGAIDREAGSTQSITVQATSADGSTSTQTYSIAINDVDEFDVTAISDSNATANAVTENAAVGTTVGITASASDADATNSGITYSLSNSAGGKFAINSTTGVVTVAGAIDRESGATQSITVVATSADGSSSSQTYSIAVADVDEFDVTAISDSNVATNSVNENAAVGTTVGITAAASDADATNSGVTYSLSNSAGGKFAINSTTGVVTVAGALNYEAAASHSITVVATSADGSTSTQTYTVGVNDLNDETPTNIVLSNSTINEEATGKVTFTLAGEKFGAAPIVEVFANGVSLGTVTLTNAHDTVANGYAELSELEAVAQTFTMSLPIGVTDPGTISFKLVNDAYDAGTGYDTNFYVKSVSVGETSLNGSQGTGAAATSGVWGSVSQQDSPISFAAPSGGWDTRQIVGTLTTTDADASNSFTYTITSDPSGLFAVSGDEIIVKPGMETNFEANTSHTITVQVNDGNGHTFSKNLTIGVNNLNEAPTDIQFTGNSALAITDGGTLVGAKVDAHPDLRVAYALDEGTGTTATSLSGTQTMTLMNGASWTSAPVGSALDFAGGTTNAGAQARITPFVSTGAISVSMYARMDNVDGGTKEWQRLFDFGTTTNTINGGQVFDSDDMRLEVILNGVYYSVVAPDAIQDGEWAHWSFTVSETGLMSIYKNGDLLAQGQGAVPNLDGNGVYRLGASSFSGDDSLDGAIADFTIHTDDLTPAEVSVLANQSSVGFTADNSIANVSGVSNYISGDTFSYSLTDSAGGAFAINAATGAITLTQEFAVPGGDPEFVLQNGSISPFNGIDQGAYSKPQLVDIDNDGDLDLFVGRDSGGLAYYRNMGTATNPNYVFQQHNPFTLNTNATYGDVTFVDINNDGDMDAFVSDSNGNTQYFQNTGTAGNPSFAAAVSNPFGLSDMGSHTSITFADLDGDGDKDAIIGDDAGNLDYFRNTGTASSPTFTFAGANLFDLSDVGTYASPEFADFDGDGDLDALVGRGDGQFSYFENTGTTTSPNFALQETNPFGLSDLGDNVNIDAADVDGDGDMDLVVGKPDGTIAYFKNVATQSGSAYSDTVTVKVTNGAGESYSETIGIQLGTDGNDTLTGTAGSDIIYGMDEAGTTSGSNLIVNGSFEALDVASSNDYTSMSGWTASSGVMQLIDDAASGSFGGATASDGSQFVEMDAQGSVDAFFQNVQTEAGVQYTLGLDAAARSGQATNTIQIYWNNVLVSSVNPTSTSFQSYEFTVTGTGGLDKLEFREVAGENNSLGGLLDNISLFAVGGDTLSGAAGDDAIYGGAGNDKLYGGDGNDILAGGSGRDIISGGAGTDTADYSGSSAAVTVNLSTAAVSGGDAAGDSISSIENVTGSIYNDNLTGDGNANVLSGGDGMDTLTGGGGDDTLVGGAGVDTLYGGDGNDRLEGGSGNDTIWGGIGNDSIEGGSGDDTVYGEDGDDTIVAGGGNDIVQGGNGNDIITGSTGNDNLQGNAGSDTFLYTAGDGSDTVNGGAAGGWTDIISLQGMDGSIAINGATVTGQGWTMQLTSGTVGAQSGESLTLSTDADGTITFTDGSVMTFTDVERVTW